MRELGARLVGEPEVEVDADVGVVAFLAVDCILHCQDVEGDHQAVDGHQDALILLIHLQEVMTRLYEHFVCDAWAWHFLCLYREFTQPEPARATSSRRWVPGRSPSALGSWEADS